MNAVDAFGNSLSVGDVVAYAVSGYTDLKQAVVIGFTEKKIKVSMSHRYYSDRLTEQTKFPGQLAKMRSGNELNG